MISNKHFKLADPIHFEYTEMVSISQSTIDCTVTLVQDGVEVKFDVPTSVSYRLRKTIGKITRFSTAHPVCVGWVGKRIVCIECPDKAALPSARKGAWKSLIEINLSNFILAVPPDVYFDGQYVYTLDVTPEEFDKNFGVAKLTYCRDLYHCNDISWSIPSKACFAYRNGNKWVVSAPVTSATGSFLQLVGDDVTSRTAAIFDSMAAIDTLRFVNLRFVNYAAGRLANAFDFETIEPLGLPLLMIEHGTFNLGELTPTVQMTCPAPLTFSQALAWLIGLHNRVTTLDQLIALKEALKMLMSKGCTRSAAVMGAGDEIDDGSVDVSKNAVVYAARNHFKSMPLVEFA